MSLKSLLFDGAQRRLQDFTGLVGGVCGLKGRFRWRQGISSGWENPVLLTGILLGGMRSRFR